MEVLDKYKIVLKDLEVGTKVWSAEFGEGEISDISHRPCSMPIEAKFGSLKVDYTNQGQRLISVLPTLFYECPYKTKPSKVKKLKKGKGETHINELSLEKPMRNRLEDREVVINATKGFTTFCHFILGADLYSETEEQLKEAEEARAII